MQKITPFLWFDKQAEEAANFYTSIFKNSKVKNVVRYNEAGAKASGQPEGSVTKIAANIEHAVSRPHRQGWKHGFAMAGKSIH